MEAIEPQMNRRRLILSAAGLGLAASGLAVPANGHAALAATDDELAYANFGQAAEFLLRDFYARTAAAELMRGDAAREIARGHLNATQHADALSKLLAGAGQSVAVEEDFEFAWPDGTFASQSAAATTGLKVAQPLLGVYLTASSTISIASYRTLFASMGASLAQQVGSLTRLAGGRIVGVSFPPMIDLPTASDAIEAYLG